MSIIPPSGDERANGSRANATKSAGLPRCRV